MLSPVLGLLLALALPAGSAQPTARADTVRPAPPAERARHATLFGWDRRVRTAVWDRSHAVGGLYADRGVLGRWTRQMDHEYDLDLFSILPTPADDAAFYASPRGVRTSAGSITTAHFVVESEVQTGARLAGPLALDLRVVQQEDLSAERALVELGYRVDLGRGHAVALRHSLASLKVDLDVELVYAYRHRRLDVELAAGRLDGLNNLVNATLVPSPVHVDTLRVYETPPVWLRGRVSVPVGPARVEAVGGVTPAARAAVRSQTVEQARFSYESAFRYGGVLAEVELAGPALVVGATASGSRSASARRTPPDVAERSDVASRQLQLRGGVFALGAWRALRGQAWWTRERAADQQGGSAFAGATVDGPYDVEERWTWTRLRLDWVPGAARGPLVGAEVAAGLRRFPVEGDQEEIQREVLRFFPYGPNRRVTLRAGYRFSPRADVVFGASVDLDGDPFLTGQDNTYDGAYVRLRALW